MRRSTATGTDAVLHAASVGDNQLDRSPDGSRIAFMEWGETEARMMTMSATGGEAVEVATTPVEHFGARSYTRLPGVMWLPGGRELLLVRGADGRQGEWDFFRVSADGGAETRIGRMRTEKFETGFYGIMHLRLSADGTRVAFHQNTGTISQMWAIDDLLAFIQSGETHRAPRVLVR